MAVTQKEAGPNDVSDDLVDRGNCNPEATATQRVSTHLPTEKVF